MDCSKGTVFVPSYAIFVLPQAYLVSAKEEFEKEKVAFAEKSTKLDAIMRQVQGLAAR